jgi:Type II CAAX prenyl endopeptidase Rce1-like
VADPLATLVLLGAVALLLLLRLDARRFGAAEYDDEEAPGGVGAWTRRLSWYFFGLLLIALVYFLYPQPLTVLHLQVGDARETALLAGLALGVIGTAAAFGYAWLHLGGAQLPSARRYPAGLLNSVLTAFIDEAAFRGIVLGLLLASDWPIDLAIVFPAVLYTLTTRLAATGRPRGPMFMTLGLGLVAGWLTVQTGGIGAALLGHGLTRLAVFVSTGHAGAMRTSPSPEKALPAEPRELAPAGWEVVPDHEPGLPQVPR